MIDVTSARFRDRGIHSEAGSGCLLCDLLFDKCYYVHTMGYSVGIRELRQQASAILKRVAGGETIDVTDYGHPIARIVPLKLGAMDQLVLEGRATQAVGDLLDIADEMGLPVDGRGPVLPSGALVESRNDER